VGSFYHLFVARRCTPPAEAGNCFDYPDSVAHQHGYLERGIVRIQLNDQSDGDLFRTSQRSTPSSNHDPHDEAEHSVEESK